jgi:hypothetical protein
MSAAGLVPAPPPALAFVIAVCVGYPMLAGWRASSSLAVLRHRWPGRRLDERALGELRRDLDRLPETSHPLDRRPRRVAPEKLRRHGTDLGR